MAFPLFDGDGRRQSGDGFDVRLGGHVQKLAGVGGKALHIAALSFDIYGVEGEAGLARPGEAGKHGQGVSGEIDGDVAEIVLPGPDDANELVRHNGFLVLGFSRKSSMPPLDFLENHFVFTPK